MRSFIVFFAALVLSATATAKVDSAAWDALVLKAANEGVVSVYDGMEFHSLTQITPNDVSQPRQAEYISTVGVVDSDGVYHVMEVSAVSENWSIDGTGNWIIDQYTYRAKVDGELVEAFHHTLTEDKGGSVVDYETKPLSDEEKQTAWEAKQQEWLK